MSIYTNDGDKINTAAIYDAMEYAQDAQQIERGEIFYYVNDIVGVYGKFSKTYWQQQTVTIYYR